MASSPLMGAQLSEAGRYPRLSGSTNPNADWMSALCPSLWDVPLQHLSIPGEGCVSPCGLQGGWKVGKAKKHTCVYPCARIHTRAHIRTCMCSHTYTCSHCTHTCPVTHADRHTCTHTLTVTHTYTYTPPHSHVHARSQSQAHTRTYTSVLPSLLYSGSVWEAHGEPQETDVGQT